MKRGWNAALAHPLPVKGGGTLTTLRDANDYIVNEIPAGHHGYNAWQNAGRLLIAAAETGTDIEAATQAMEGALFLDYRLNLKRLYAKT